MLEVYSAIWSKLLTAFGCLEQEVSGMPTHLNSGKGANADKGQTSSQPLGIKESLPKSFVRQDLSKG